MKLLLALIMAFSFSVFAADNIALVYVDQKTEQSLGEFPIARSYYAKFVEVASKYQPKYIILKFFFDQRKDGDDVLIKELKKHKNVLTQAFSYYDKNKSQVAIFPYKEMADAFSGIGFVNGITDKKGLATDFEIVSSYKGEMYPSLPLLILEKELKAKFKVEKNVLKIASKSIKLPKNYGMGLKLKKPGSYKTYSMIDVLDGKIGKKELKDKILIVFYNGPKLTPAPATNGQSYNPAEYVANAIEYLLFLVHK